MLKWTFVSLFCFVFCVCFLFSSQAAALPAPSIVWEDDLLLVVQNDPEDALEFIEVFDESGNLVLLQENCAPQLCAVDFSGQNSGTYTVVIHTENGTETEKAHYGG